LNTPTLKLMMDSLDAETEQRPKKLICFDVETTGLDPQSHGIVQIAMLIDIDGEVKGEQSFLICPKSKIYDPKALEVHGHNEIMISTYPGEEKVHERIISWMSLFIDKYDKNDKGFALGYNVGFDENFLRVHFHNCGDNYYGSFFNNRSIDILQLVNLLEYAGKFDLSDRKLSTLCTYYEIPITAHDALSDIKATRTLFYKLLQEVKTI